MIMTKEIIEKLILWEQDGEAIEREQKERAEEACKIANEALKRKQYRERVVA